MATFPDVDVKDFTSSTATTVKGFDLGSSKTALAHMLVDTTGNSIIKQEDAASASGDAGLPILVKRSDTPAATSGTDGDYEPMQSKAGHLAVMTPTLVKVNSNFQRPNDTTSYSANDAVANNTTAGSVTPLSWTITRGAGTIERFRLKKTQESIATATFRLFLFDASPTAGAGDNAAFVFPAADCIGIVDIAAVNAGSDVAVGFTSQHIPFVGGTIYGLLQTLTAITSPEAQETYNIDIWYRPEG